MYPIIDCHCHIYPDKIAVKAAKSTGAFYDMDMNYDGKLSTLESIDKRAHITHSVVFSVATTPKQVKSINEYIASVVKNSGGTMTGLGTLHPDSEDIPGDIRHLKELGLKGVKLHPKASFPFLFTPETAATITRTRTASSRFLRSSPVFK